jgi:uncharacterized NAD(P)/FAD-binding protein YdhS
MMITAGHGAAKTSLIADAVVLATGNLAPRTFGFLAGINDPQAQYVPDVWNVGECPEFTKRIKYMPKDAEIVILGTGLTMVDMLLTLKAKGFTGKITAISRSGLLPAIHKTHKPYPDWLLTVEPNRAPKTALGLLAAVRKEIKHAEAKGYDWRAVVDSLRPVTQQLWQRLNMLEKRRFFAKLSTLWNSHRHRMAPEIHAQVQAMQQEGALRIIAGMVYYVGSENGGLTFTFRRRRQNTFETIYPALVINCTGPEQDIAKCRHELLKNLRDSGLINIGPLRVGVEIGSNLAAKGKALDALFPIGPMLAGEYLECTSVPELRDVADKIAAQVLRRVDAVSSADEQNNFSHGEWI